MAFQMDYTKVTKTPEPGKAICPFVGFYAEPTDMDSLVNAQGKVVVQTVVKDTTDGTFHDPEDQTVAMLELDLLPAVQRTYCGGTVTGAQVLQAISEMCELGWDGTLPRKTAP